MVDVSKKLEPELLIWAMGKLRHWAGRTAVYYTVTLCVDCTGGVCEHG